MQLNIDYPLIGGSPLFPNISCEAKRDVCIVTTGEAEINAAATSAFAVRRGDGGALLWLGSCNIDGSLFAVTALTLSRDFDLTNTVRCVTGDESTQSQS